MTLDEDLAKRIAEDAVLSRVLAKADSGTADFTDTSRYHDRMAEIVGAVMREHVLEVPAESRSALCERVLRDRYRDSAELLARVQEALDASLGIRLAPQIPAFQTERVRKIGHSLEDATAPDEKIQRRAESASANVVRAFQDRYVQENARFRSDAGLKCWIVRDAGAKCCDWCAGIDGKYEYGSEPKDVYGRHDNCTCTVTYENGRKRQDVWSKRTWEQPEEGAGAGEPVRFTTELPPQGASPPERRYLKAMPPENPLMVLTSDAESGNIENEGDILTRLTNLAAFNGYLNKVSRFEEELRHIARDDIRAILAKASSSAQFKKSKKNVSYYNGEERTVFLRNNCDLSTIAHELFHFIDHEKGFTANGELDDCIASDFERIVRQAQQFGMPIDVFIHAKYPGAFSKIDKMKPEYRGVSDIICGMTAGEVKFGYGHKKSYWRKKNALQKETFAQYGRMYFEGNPQVMELIEDLFPDTTAKMEEIVARLTERESD